MIRMAVLMALFILACSPEEVGIQVDTAGKKIGGCP
jgi:hypothetical protein